LKPSVGAYFHQLHLAYKDHSTSAVILKMLSGGFKMLQIQRFNLEAGALPSSTREMPLPSLNLEGVTA